MTDLTPDQHAEIDEMVELGATTNDLALLALYRKLQADLDAMTVVLDAIVNPGPEACTCHTCTEGVRAAGRAILLAMKGQP